ncbi:glomulin-like isoform X2 [Clavelina lepadiformis]|uniref:glomulin-like isoform X2 n=1 Tax=Clavelina lepadiformis TaxID=159417 RepID=UPI004042F03F
MESVDENSGNTLNFMSQVKQIIKEGNISQLKNFCSDKENEEQVIIFTMSDFNVICSSLDLVSCFMDYLKDHEANDQDMENFGDLFSHISYISNEKELILGFLEQFDPMVEFDIINCLFPGLEIVCAKIMERDKANQTYHLNMVFSSFVYYAESLNLPKYDNYDPMEEYPERAEELKLAKFMKKCTEVGRSMLEIIQQQFQQKEIHKNHIKAVNCEFFNLCIGLLERLSRLNLEELTCTESAEKLIGKKSKDQNSVSQGPHAEPRLVLKTASDVCSLLHSLHCPWTMHCNMTWKNLISSDRKLSQEEFDRLELARGCYLYLIFDKGHGIDLFPQMDHPLFSFKQCIPGILSLLKQQDSVMLHKGLALCRYASNRLDPLTIHNRYLTNALKETNWHKPVSSLFQSAIHISTHCPSKTLRQRSGQFIVRFLDKFVWTDRYNILYSLITNAQHPGMVGYLIGYFKDKLSEILQQQMPIGSSYFLERSHHIIKISVALKEGSETDLLSEYNRLMSSLNMLRFLFIRDKNNKTQIWNIQASIEEQFLEPLRTGINLSRMHFRDELKKQSHPRKEVSNETEFSICGTNLSTFPLMERKQALESAIHSFDMLENISIRVQEIIDQHRSTIEELM